MNRTTGTLFAMLSLAVAACAGCGSRAEIDPQADQALRSMSDLLSKAQALSFQAEGTMDEVLETGQLSQFSRKSKIILARPGRLHAETEGDDVSRSAWYDGKTVTVLDKRENVYGSVQVPNTIEKMLDLVIEKYGLTLPVADLLFRNPYKTFIAEVESGTYVGRHNVGDHVCHHLAFRQESIDWQIWIDAGKTPVPRKLVITYKQEPGHPHYVVVLDQWDLSPKHSGDTFAFRPPAGAKRVEMTELLGVEEGE